MNIRPVLHLVSWLLMILSLAIAACWGFSIYFQDALVAINGMASSALIVFASGLIGSLLTRGSLDLSRRDGFGIVTFGWVAAATFGALPYLMTHSITDPIAAVFETMSGFTTTGASILSDLESLPKGILLWRSLTQWFGGMGVLVLCVAILPFLGVGGMQIYRAEMPGPSKDRLTPKIATTAKLLWGVYLALTIIETILLKLGGMSWFDAVCHSFATVSTGGFSTRTAGIAEFNSLFIECVIMLFMFLSGINFALHFKAMRGDRKVYLKDPEFRFYIGVCIGGILFLAFNIWRVNYPGFGEALRASTFQCLSILTTTGFSTADFNLWPSSSRMMLLVFMVMGGCAGSTAGGLKLVRISVLSKKTFREIRRVIQPQAVLQVKLGKKSLDSDIVSNIASFFIIFSLLFVGASWIMSFFTPDLETAASSVLATLGNIGPGIAAVGPMENFSFIAWPGKLVLTFCMLLGRLELYTVLSLLLPGFWKK